MATDILNALIALLIGVVIGHAIAMIERVEKRRREDKARHERIRQRILEDIRRRK